MVSIRVSDASDRDAIREVHASAFGAEHGPEIIELVDQLMIDPTAAPSLSLVADSGGELAGHVVFTRVAVAGHPGVSARILAPLAVSTDCQGMGVGGALVRAGLQHLETAGVDLVFVLGHPGYYPRFGFRPAGEVGLEAPHPIPAVHADAWMVRAASNGVLGLITGRIQCSESLGQVRHWQA
jgi:predicted N-acetyltransferase YhbS